MPSSVPTASPTVIPSVMPSLVPTASPTVIPSVVPSLRPTSSPTQSTSAPSFYLSDKTVGYYYTTIFKGYTCENLIGNEDYAIEQSGMSFGNCIVGYNSSGQAVSSASYTSKCEIIDDNFKITFTKYSDLNCQVIVSETDVSQSSLCQTVGDFTSLRSCVAQSNSPPYKDLAGGYSTG